MHLVFLSCLLAAAAFLPAAQAADAAAGKKKASACAVCHGLDGLSKNPDAPNLAGDSAGYIISQLKAFQAGTRQNDQMSIMAEGLSEDDIANLAAWYSSIKVKVELPQ